MGALPKEERYFTYADYKEMLEQMFADYHRNKMRTGISFDFDIYPPKTHGKSRKITTLGSLLPPTVSF